MILWMFFSMNISLLRWAMKNEEAVATYDVGDS